MEHKIKACIFDLDGTLLDTLPDLVVITNKSLSEAGFPKRSEPEILSFVGAGVKALIRQAVPAGTDEASVEEVMAHWKALYPRYGSLHTKEYAGMTPMLQQLRRRSLALGVLSNKFDEGVQHLVQEYFPGLFDVAHGEGDGIPRKPDPAGLLKTIGELQAGPESALYIGDSPTDVATAHAAGVSAVGVSWGYHDAEALQGAGADHVIGRPGDLPGLLG